MRVMALTRYGRMGASSRVRTLQYIRFLETNDIEVDVSPLFSDDYLTALYQGRARVGPALVGFCRRVAATLHARQYDVLWIEKELLPFLPAFAERLLARIGVPWVVDYDDALFHRYDKHDSAWVRRLLGRKIDTVMRLASLVVAGNEYLAERARAAGARQVEVVPTVVDLQRYPLARSDEHDRCTIGWIGSPSTAKYLASLQEPLSRIQKAHGVRIRLVGAGDVELAGCDIEVVEWEEATEAAHVASFDIGIMPLPDTPWERGKCGYKLIQYMACGKPVVASPVGVNVEIVNDWQCGLLADGAEQWFQALANLLESPDTRREQRQAVNVLAPVSAELDGAGDVALQAEHPRLNTGNTQIAATLQGEPLTVRAQGEQTWRIALPEIDETISLPLMLTATIVLDGDTRIIELPPLVLNPDADTGLRGASLDRPGANAEALEEEQEEPAGSGSSLDTLGDELGQWLSALPGKVESLWQNTPAGVRRVARETRQEPWFWLLGGLLLFLLLLRRHRRKPRRRRHRSRREEPHV